LPISTRRKPPPALRDGRVNALQVAVDRLTAFMDKVLHTQKKRTDANAAKTGQAQAGK
jgi:hypothetical protein